MRYMSTHISGYSLSK